MGDNRYMDIDTSIKRNQLDSECIRLPNQIQEACAYLADREKALDRSKANRDVVLAELDQCVRLEPERHGIPGRVTETQITNAVGSLTSAQKVKDAVITAKHAVDIAKALVNALMAKKSMLETLVKLHGQGYFSDPKVSAEDAEAFERDRPTVPKRKKKFVRKKKETA